MCPTADASAAHSSELDRARRELESLLHDLWAEIAPHLDEALDEISSSDRQTLLLRFFQQKSTRQIGELLNVSENAAKMRVSRALKTLREKTAVRNGGKTFTNLSTRHRRG